MSVMQFLKRLICQSTRPKLATRPRLALEALEAREVPAVFTWLYTGSGWGDSNDPANWDQGDVPTSGDVVHVPGGTGSMALAQTELAGLVISISWGNDIACASLYLAGSSTLDSGSITVTSGRLEIAGGTTTAGSSAGTPSTFSYKSSSGSAPDLFVYGGAV